MLKEQLPESSQQLIARAEQIVSDVGERFAETLDRENRFPTELWAALHEAGLDAMCVPETQGGRGLGPDIGDPLPVWLVTRAIAKVDSSSSHCQQVHTNMCHTVAVLGTDEQKERFLRPVAEQTAVLGGWGSEQSGLTPTGGIHVARVPQRRPGTSAKRVRGGWELTGTKFYSTNAGAAKYAVVFAYPEDSTNPVTDLLLCMVDCEGAGVTVKPEWWEHATGMRSTVSHEVEFDRVFVDDGAVIGAPGSYWDRQLQARYLCQFAANFQGAGAHVFDYGTRYLRDHQRTNSPFVQRYIAEARIELLTAELLLEATAQAYREADLATAFHYSRMLRAYSEQVTHRVFDLIEASCGASFYMRPHPTERMLRDWQFYSRHENRDLILASIGQAEFGQSAEGAASFGFGGVVGATAEGPEGTGP